MKSIQRLICRKTLLDVFFPTKTSPKNSNVEEKAFQTMLEERKKHSSRKIMRLFQYLF